MGHFLQVIHCMRICVYHHIYIYIFFLVYIDTLMYIDGRNTRNFVLILKKRVCCIFLKVS